MYTTMNYGAPTFAYGPGFGVGAAPGTLPPTGTLPPGTFNPYYPYGPAAAATAAAVGRGIGIPNPKQRFGCNTNYLKSPLGLLKLLLIPSLIGTVIASALVRNRDFAVRTESAWDTSVWISTLVFACVGLATVLWQFLFNVCNCVNLPGLRLIPCTILNALFDLGWFAALTVLGAFCARREAVNKSDFKNVSLNKGAFGVTAAFALLSALLFLLSGLLGLAKRKVPLRTF